MTNMSNSPAEMMVVALSRFKVANGCEAEVREAFVNRPGLVDNVAGFLGLEVFTDAEDASVFYLITRWTDADSFRKWHSGPDHNLAHLGIPKGLKLDASFTLIRILDRISGTRDLARPDSVRDSASLISEFLDRSASVCWLKVRSDGLIDASNEAFRTRVGIESLDGALIWPLLTDPDAATLRRMVSEGKRGAADGYRFNFIGREQMPLTLTCRVDVQPAWFVLIGEPVQQDELDLQHELMMLNNQLAVQLRENDRQAKALRRAKAELERALTDLVESQRHLIKLQEVIPICMTCGKVKNTESKWEDVAAYFHRNNLLLSHGYCPDCCEIEMAKLDQ
jgi:heme-degrading monooxygenase HmoA